MIKKTIRVAVTGAAGQIGYALLFRIASGEMFGLETEIELQLLELPGALSALEGVAMELQDGAFPLLKSVIKTDDPRRSFEGVDWALLVGSVPRKAGMERKDLLQINGRIFIEQGRALSEVANPTCKVLVIGNPCNTNAYIAKTACRNIPEKNFFALMMLDQNRACALLAQKAGCRITYIKNMIVWGNHSSTQFPNFYDATIKGKEAYDVLDEKWLQTEFLTQVQQRGAEIIKARGMSSAASAAQAVIETVKNIYHPILKNECFSVAVASDGSYGIEKGLMFGFPVLCSQGDWHIAQNISMNHPFIKEKMDNTYQELLAEKKAVEDILL